MGYDVYYNGEVTVTPPLTEADATVLRCYAQRPTVKTQKRRERSSRRLPPVRNQTFRGTPVC
jgi:hypothetical protein